MGFGKVIHGLWVMGAGVALLLCFVILFFQRPTQKVPQQFVCAPQSLNEKVSQATQIVSGHVEVILPGKPYADVWVKTQTAYKGPTEKYVRFAAWPKATGQAKIGDLHFSSSEKEYLFFFRPLKNGTLTTSACYGTRELTSGLTTQEQALLEAQ